MDTQVVTRALENINSIFSNILLETNYLISENSISWPRYMPGFPQAIVYAAEYQRLIDKKQLSFLLIDKSFFQFFFDFKNEELISARLAYYPAPVKISGALDDLVEIAEASGLDLLEELYLGAENWIDRGIDVLNTSHVRLDFDSTVDTHPPCHLQFGGINEFRIPSSSLINPFVFFAWVSKYFNINGVDEITQKAQYKEFSRYHIRRSLDVGGIENDHPHIVASTNIY